MHINRFFRVLHQVITGHETKKDELVSKFQGLKAAEGIAKAQELRIVSNTLQESASDYGFYVYAGQKAIARVLQVYFLARKEKLTSLPDFPDFRKMYDLPWMDKIGELDRWADKARKEIRRTKKPSSDQRCA